ncbi:MAG: T9SS type A sorting domain-containing protein, partial [bacterium]
GNDQYVYAFSPPGTWSTLEYKVLATDNLNNVGFTPSYTCWYTGETYTAGAEVLFLADNAYEGLWGIENYDSTITAILDDLGYAHDYWDVDDNGAPDHWTVLSNYDFCIWVGYCDYDSSVFPMESANNPFSDYLQNGGSFLWSSEEMLGKWTGWVDTTFEAGNFAHDWLNIGDLYNDIGFTSIEATGDILCTGITSPFGYDPPPLGSMSDYTLPATGAATADLFFEEGGTVTDNLCGLRDDTDQYNSVALAFCLFHVDYATRLTFISNVLDYFSSTAPLTVQLIPHDPPVVIPANGGSFDFDVIITNNESAPQTFDGWIMVTLPDNTQYGPVFGPVNLTLPGGESLNVDRTQSVPAVAPAGVYTYTGYAGEYPTSITVQSSFTFEKLTTGDGPLISGWANTGDSFDKWMTCSKVEVPLSFALHGAYPNPFNPTTTISFDLPQVSHVKLTIYDLQGRLITELVNGVRDAGTHKTTWNASSVSSGLYFYRIEAGEFTAVEKMVLIK